MKKDEFDLYNKARTLADKRTDKLSPLFGKGTWEGHVDQVTKQQNGLKSNIREYDTLGCNSLYKKLPSSSRQASSAIIPTKPD